MEKLLACGLLALCFTACSGPNGAGDAGPQPPQDSGAEDAGATDAGPRDAGPPVDAGPVDYLIIAANPLEGSARRWRDWRADGGHRVAVETVGAVLGGATSPAAAAAAIHGGVRRYWSARDPARPFYLLLLGDADPAGVNTDTVPFGRFVEPFDGGTRIVTDNLYADMNGDHIPDLAVGRIPVRSELDADLVRTKIAASEGTYRVGPWNRRVNVFASTAGFGEPADSLIEAAMIKIVEEIPYTFGISMTFAKQQSPWVYVPEQFSDKVYQRLNQGAVMMTYVGHGSNDSFADLVWNGNRFPIMDTTALSKLAPAPRSPVLSLVACLTGAFHDGDSFSERVLRSADGPAVVLSSTEVSHPYANAIFIRELSQALTARRAPTVGLAFIEAKRQTIENNDPLRQTIDAQVGLLLSIPARVALKISHQYMYELFGDPAMRLAWPGEGVVLTVPAPVIPGSGLAVSASFTGLVTGQATVTFETRRSAYRGALLPVPPDGSPDRDAAIIANYATANDPVVVSATTAIAGSALSVTLPIPAGLAPGEYVVKVYAEDGARDAAASVTVTIP